MKNEKELKKEIDKILADNVSARVKVFQAQREEAIKEILGFSKVLEEFEAKRTNFLEEKKGLNMLVNKDLSRGNYLDQHIPWLEKEIKGLKGQIEEIIRKLTDVPEFDLKTLNFFSSFFK